MIDKSKLRFLSDNCRNYGTEHPSNQASLSNLYFEYLPFLESISYQATE